MDPKRITFVPDYEGLDPEVDRILPTLGCQHCEFKSWAQSDGGLRNAWSRHRKETGHKTYWQRKFAPADPTFHARHGSPTFRCKLPDCQFTTRAYLKRSLVEALRKHMNQTGHTSLVIIPGALVSQDMHEDEIVVDDAWA